MKFTPTPRTKNISEVKTDTLEFCRRLRLAENFLDFNEEEDGSIVRNKSNFIPSKEKNKALDTFCDVITKFPINEVQNKGKRSNFSNSQWNTLEELSKDDTMIIKEADKGNAVVIMDKSDYKDLTMSIL